MKYTAHRWGHGRKMTWETKKFSSYCDAVKWARKSYYFHIEE